MGSVQSRAAPEVRGQGRGHGCGGSEVQLVEQLSGGVAALPSVRTCTFHPTPRDGAACSRELADCLESGVCPTLGHLSGVREDEG